MSVSWDGGQFGWFGSHALVQGPVLGSKAEFHQVHCPSEGMEELAKQGGSGQGSQLCFNTDAYNRKKN